MKYTITILLTIFTLTKQSIAQLPDSCKLFFGTNLAGLSDWGAEQPFKNLMRSSREWYTKDVDNPDYPFNSGHANALSYLPNGYPTHSPQLISESTYLQRPATIWGNTSGWQPGNYIVIFEGEGVLSFGGGVSELSHPTDSTYTFFFENPIDNIVEMVIDSSSVVNPIQNIRIIHVDYLHNYIEEPFHPNWLEKLRIFPAVRFMDWGRTNNWSKNESWEWDDPNLVDWVDRAKFDYYTWTTNKGIPYEMMIYIMNEYDLDGWICVPHNTSEDYQIQMAQFFLNNLSPERKITVEYSNEIWNWMFGQAQWTNKYGCVEMGITWPEGTVPYIQSCMDNWTNIWEGHLSRLTRVVGVQTGWLDVAQRTAFNMDNASIDGIAATYYFGINDSADSILDEMGEMATVEDIASLVRSTWHESKNAIQNIKEQVADSLNVPILFYEGGQHITPTPFGEEPSYANSLLEIQRDTSMYNLYNEWYDFIRTLQEGDEPLLLMNFSFISGLSARYGSWGIWETMFQDTNVIPAPKIVATRENIFLNCWNSPTNISPDYLLNNDIKIFPNPTLDNLFIESPATYSVSILDMFGRLKWNGEINKGKNVIDVSQWANGMYILRIEKYGSLKFIIQR